MDVQGKKTNGAKIRNISFRHLAMDAVVKPGVVSLEDLCQVVQYFLYSPPAKKLPSSPGHEDGEEDAEDDQLKLPLEVRLKILRDLLQQLASPHTVLEKSSTSKGLPPRVSASIFRNVILDRLGKISSMRDLLVIFGNR